MMALKKLILKFKIPTNINKNYIKFTKVITFVRTNPTLRSRDQLLEPHKIAQLVLIFRDLQ